MARRDVFRYGRATAALLVCFATGALAAVGLSVGGDAAAAAYYYYCPGGRAGSNYGTSPPPPPTTPTPAKRPPVCAPDSGPLGPVSVGSSVNVSAPFTDPDTSDTHTATIGWGDGSSTPGTVTESSGSGTITGSHVYTATGVYTVTVTVLDNRGGSGVCVLEFIVVFDANAGFVTGGGWIMSPPGAYTLNPALTGKATFGFVSKYQKGATVPSGNTEFQFHAGDLNFKSTSYQWLVIAGPKAMYKGEGTINGEPGYSFQLSAIDGAIAGGGGTDKFRIRIWETATNVVIYDNKLGAPDNADPTTVLGGGSIVIHKGK